MSNRERREGRDWLLSLSCVMHLQEEMRIMHTNSYRVMLLAVGVLAACGGSSPEPTPDSTVAIVATPDTTTALALRDSAKATLATLAAHATFDSVVVIQPPHDGERLPAMAVCGRISGLPGRPSSVRFVYQSKWTVFVEESVNQAAFGELWARSCAVAGGMVVVRD